MVQISRVILVKLPELNGLVGIDASLDSTTGGVAPGFTNLAWVVHFEHLISEYITCSHAGWLQKTVLIRCGEGDKPL